MLDYTLLTLNTVIWVSVSGNRVSAMLLYFIGDPVAYVRFPSRPTCVSKDSRSIFVHATSKCELYRSGFEVPCSVMFVHVRMKVLFKSISLPLCSQIRQSRNLLESTAGYGAYRRGKRFDCSTFAVAKVSLRGDHRRDEDGIVRVSWCNFACF